MRFIEMLEIMIVGIKKLYLENAESISCFTALPDEDACEWLRQVEEEKVLHAWSDEYEFQTAVTKVPGAVIAWHVTESCKLSESLD
ncbi:hypothetical protein T4E_7064 [Trichinella pseudospiralis]|uniref:Uncharacterized protein n=1 Tax=Trichinella pseudospiralis TaxID=6337 RepID=A0A0V0XNN0_TRIPS|nr:hypothetical protein T4E_7064 [Trichinella pseudospiralis]